MRGEEPIGGSPQGQQPKVWGPWAFLNAPKADADPRSDAGE